VSESKEVLIVDDDPQLTFGVSRRLEAAGYATRIAADGAEGVAQAQLRPPDLILLDVMMPKMDGMSALARLHSDGATRDVPVIMLSASLPDQRKALDAGARFFLKKPYSHEELFAAMEQAVAS
jgi:CheY-like chemotaxis protein